jgi:pimeloyl-ACP methyl ester carboxylesterase
MADAFVPDPRRGRTEVMRGGAPFEIAWVGFGDPQRPVDLIFLHANGFNGLTYRHILEPLGATQHVIAIDQRGHGRTPQQVTADGRGDILDLRDDLLALIETLAPDRPIRLSGHSLGGCAALLAAAARPSAVRSLTLFDPVVLSPETSRAAAKNQGPMTPDPPIAAKARIRRAVFPDREAAFEAYRRSAIFAPFTDAVLRDYVADGFRDLADGTVELSCAPEWEASNFVAHRHNIWEDLPRIEADISIYRAETGSTCALTQAGEIPNAAARSIQVETLPGVGHFVPMQCPDLVRRTLSALD